MFSTHKFQWSVSNHFSLFQMRKQPSLNLFAYFINIYWAPAMILPIVSSRIKIQTPEMLLCISSSSIIPNISTLLNTPPQNKADWILQIITAWHATLPFWSGFLACRILKIHSYPLVCRISITWTTSKWSSTAKMTTNRHIWHSWNLCRCWQWCQIQKFLSRGGGKRCQRKCHFIMKTQDV